MNLDAERCSTDYVVWLRQLADRAGKGTINHVDAPTLGRVAEILERQAQIIQHERDRFIDLEERLKTLEEKIKHLQIKTAGIETAGLNEGVTLLLTMAEVQERTGLSQSTIYAAIKDINFPAPVKLGKMRSRWVATDVDEWIQKRIDERNAL